MNQGICSGRCFFVTHKYPSSGAYSQLRNLMLSLQSDAENADELQLMANVVIRNFVKKHHTRALNHLTNAKGNKKNMWKTYVYEDGKRKEICKKQKTNNIVPSFSDRHR